MAVYLNDVELDAGLNSIQDNVGALHICSALPATYAEATSTYSLGSKTSPSVAEPSDKSGGGREIVVAAITDGTVSSDGTASYWALVKTTATTRLLAAGNIDVPQAVTTGNPFTLTAFPVGFPDAVTV